MKEGFGLLQDSIDELSLPLVGKLKGKNPNIIGNLGNALAKDTESQTQLTSEKLKETIENVLGKLPLEFFNVTTEINEQETIVNINLSQQLKHSLTLDANLGIPALGLQTEGNLQAAFNFDMSLTFGIHKQYGFYLDTKKTSLDTGIKVDLKGFEGRGGLGFLALDFADDQDNPTALEVTFKATLNDVDDIKKGTDKTKQRTTTVQRSLTTDSGLVIDVPASTSPENDEILAEKIATEEAAIEKKIADEEKAAKELATVEATESSKDKSSKEIEEEPEKATSKKSEKPDEQEKSDSQTLGEKETSEKKSEKPDEQEKSDSQTLGEKETSENEELEEITSRKKYESKTTGNSDPRETEEVEEEEVTAKQSQKKNEKQQKNNDDSKSVSDSGMTSETDKEATEESQTSDLPLIQRRSGGSLTGNALADRLSELGISAVNNLLPDGVTVELDNNDTEIQIAVQGKTNISQWIGFNDLPTLVLGDYQVVYDKAKKSYTFSANATVGSQTIGLSGTLAEVDNKLQWTNLQGAVGDTEISYTGGSDFELKGVKVGDLVDWLGSKLGFTDVSNNLGKDLGIDFAVNSNRVQLNISNLELEGLVKAVTGDSNLPVPLPTVNTLNITVTGDESDRSYEFSAKVNDATVSYKEKDGGYQLSLGQIDLASLGLPIPLTINSAKVVSKNGKLELSGKFNETDVKFVENEGIALRAYIRTVV